MDIVLYHGICADGFGAALLLWQKLDGNARFIPCSYENSLQTEDLRADTIYLVDFSFSFEIMQTLSRQCRRLVWLDHHQSAEPTFAQMNAWSLANGRRKGIDFIFVYDESRSGMGLTWDLLHGSRPQPEFVALIEDRDLLKFSHPKTKVFAAGIETVPYSFPAWSRAFENLDEVMSRGEAVLAYCDVQVSNMLERTAHPIRLNGNDGLAANLSAIFACEAGTRLARQSGSFGMVYWQDHSGLYHCSLRSHDGFNVAKIAEQYGGGGRGNAAAFRCDPEEFHEILNNGRARKLFKPAPVEHMAPSF